MKRSSQLFHVLGRALALGAIALGVATANAQTPAQVSAYAANLKAVAEAQRQQALFWAAANNWPVDVTLPNGVHGSIRRVEGGRPIYMYTMDRDQAKTISAASVWPGGGLGLSLTGAGITLGVWDGGVADSIPEFGSRLTVKDGGPVGGHPTNTASIAACTGLLADARGMAYTANIWAYDWNNDLAEMTTGASQGVRVSNHSYGTNVGWIFGARGDGKWVWFGDPAISTTTESSLGYYNNEARAWDDMLYNSPNFMACASAGNSRNEGPDTQPIDHWVFENGAWASSQVVRDLDGVGPGYDSLNLEKSAKNLVVVGATRKNPAGYTGPSSVVMSSFSCWGPTDDGRIKPDVVAPGVNIVVAEPGGGYSAGDGTSFSSPAVCGATAQLLGHFATTLNRTPRGATMRGLLIHTADEAGANPGPDYAFGWGQINVATAADVISKAAFNPNVIAERRLNSGGTINIPIQIGAGSALKVTICWTDPAGNVVAETLNDRTPKLVNDLDLRVINTDTNTTYLPWKLDPNNPANAATRGDNIVDNVEQVLVNNPTSGNYNIRVSHKGTGLRPSGSQDVTVIISAPIAGDLERVTVDPGSVIGGVEQAIGTVYMFTSRSTPTTVTLFTNNTAAVSVPRTVVIPANQTQASFTIGTRSVQNAVTASIVAGNNSGSVSSELTVTPVNMSGALVLSTNEIIGGLGLTGTVNLSSPAPAGGATIYLSSSRPTIAKPTRNWVLIPAGQTSITFNITTKSLVEPVDLDITARRGSVSTSAPLRVVRANLMSVTTSAAVITGGTSLTGTVTLDGPAPSGGATVLLSSSNTAVARVAARVVIPSGRTSANFTISTTRPGVATPATISATRFGVTQTRTITVNP
ncbi:MAG: S8 family serine peptidase [Armatimonadetes bacterium]|nr:S8 family serine peptidase [Armatimonadota bacterium]